MSQKTTEELSAMFDLRLAERERQVLSRNMRVLQTSIEELSAVERLDLVETLAEAHLRIGFARTRLDEKIEKLHAAKRRVRR